MWCTLNKLVFDCITRVLVFFRKTLVGVHIGKLDSRMYDACGGSCCQTLEVVRIEQLGFRVYDVESNIAKPRKRCRLKNEVVGCIMVLIVFIPKR